MTKFTIITLCILFGLNSFSQTDSTKKGLDISLPNILGKSKEDDSMTYIKLHKVTVTNKPMTRTPQQEEEYQKLKRRVIKLYPYALLAKQIREQTTQNMNSMESNKQKREYRKQKEQELRDRFENEIKALYTTDGPVLVKLIHRETGMTTYDLLRESKSWINCTIYQMAAKRYGYSLKETYDPNVDVEIESVVQMLKSEGQLPVYAPM